MDNTWLALLGFILACFLTAVSASVARPDQWYEDLAKPSWTPPNWLFGPVWTVLYAMIAVSGWLVWRDVGLAAAPFAVYALQLILNGFWSIVFFRYKRIGAAALEATALWLAIAVNIAVFWPIDVWAALLLAPYLAWVTLALTLTVSIWRLNPARRQGA